MSRRILAVLVISAAPACAQVAAPINPDEYETTAPSSVKPEHASALGGAGAGSAAKDASAKSGSNANPSESVYKPSGGGAAAASPAGGSSASAAPGGPGVLSQTFELGQDLHKTPAPVSPLLQFPTYASAPHDAVNKFQLRPVFTKPGTTYAIAFTGTAAAGDWEWVEHLDGTARCVYSAWISETPGGPSAGHRCGPIQTATQGSLYFAGVRTNKIVEDTTCFTKPGKRYWINLKQDWWPTDPSAPGAGGDGKSCIEYLKANAPSGALEL